MSLSDQVLETLDSQVAVIDSSGVILLVNSAWRAFWEEQGVAAGKLGVGKNYLRICRRIQERGNHDAMAVCAGLERVMSGEVQEFRYEYSSEEAGPLRWFDLHVVPLQGVESQFVVSHYNTTAAKATVMARQHVLTESVEHIQAVLDNMADGVVTISANGSIESFNQAACAMFGYTAESILGSNVEVLMPEPDHSHHRTYISRYLSTGEARLIGNPREVKGRRKDGTVFPMSIAVSRIDRHGVLTFVGVMRDLSRQRQDEAAIHRLAYYDTLTGLPNRHLLLERMRNAVVECGRTGQHGAVMFLDLDHFKVLNDSLGHAAGDALLQEVASRLRHAVREGDSVARVGGDEFLVLLESLSIHLHEAASQTEFIGKKLREALEHEYVLQGRSYHCTPSIGVVLFLEAQETVEELVKRADVAMYQAKTAGRNTLRFYDPAMQAAFDSHAELENDLRQGLARGEFVLHYQVQVDRLGEVLGAEALVRWNHPLRGMVSPAQFIPLAEQTGLILPLGRWVLDTACRQLVEWAASAHSASWTLAVNVSASQFAQASFVQEVSAAIEKTGANPRRLKLELTESMLVQDVDDIVLKMHAIKRAWVGFSLDDFGTGYSSLAYLKRLPLNQLKIDQSFVRDVMTDPSDAVIARTVIALGHSLGLQVIAEGVETQAQRDFLADCGCDAFQGYLFGRPGPAVAMPSYVAPLIAA